MNPNVAQPVETGPKNAPKPKAPAKDKPKPTGQAQPPARQVGRLGVSFFLFLFMALAMFLLYSIVAMWPQPTLATAESVPPAASATPTPVTSSCPSLGADDAPDVSPCATPAVGTGATEVADRSAQTQAAAQGTQSASGRQWVFWTVRIDREPNLFIIVLLSGALGATLYVLRSFYEYVGERRLVWSWVPSYIVMPIVGALSAAVAYAVLRAGLLGTTQLGTTNADGNIFGFATVGALVGLFSKQANKKLKQVFEVVFTAEDQGDHPIKDRPVIGALKPNLVSVGGELRIEGSHLAAVKAVLFEGGAAVEVTAAQEDQVTVTVPDEAQSGRVVVSTGTAVAMSDDEIEIE